MASLIVTSTFCWRIVSAVASGALSGSSVTFLPALSSAMRSTAAPRAHDFKHLFGRACRPVSGLGEPEELRHGADLLEPEAFIDRLAHRRGVQDRVGAAAVVSVVHQRRGDGVPDAAAAEGLERGDVVEAGGLA